jgi:ribosomal protein S18 acetylase RimI-like enzyme
MGSDRDRSLLIREATAADIPTLAWLHVYTWNETYPHAHSPPTVELRERQWREAFGRTDRIWFCIVVEAPGGELVGFAQGNAYTEPEPPGYAGQLNKIYLVREYKRMGLGRRLMGQVARRFLDHGITSMLLFAEADNLAACRFYEALGGENLPHPDGTASGNYGWKDLRGLAAICPTA